MIYSVMDYKPNHNGLGCLGESNHVV